MPLMTQGQTFEDLLELTFPRMQAINSNELPLAYQDLLHPCGIVETLERKYGQKIGLRVLEIALDRNHLTRRALLETESGDVAGFRVVRINLTPFSGSMYQDLLACRLPIEHLESKYGKEWRLQTEGFARVFPSAGLAGNLGTACDTELYGRRVLMIGDDGRPIADMVDILPREQASGPRTLCA